jgi:hypothetical protein
MTYIWTRAAPYIVFIAFAAISIFMWLGYCICACKPCCCCKKDDDDGACFRVTTVIVFLIANVGLILGCIIAFIYSS